MMNIISEHIDPKKYKKILGVNVHKVDCTSFNAKVIVAFYQYLWVCCYYIHIILRRLSLEPAEHLRQKLFALYNAHYYGFPIYNTSGRNWIDSICIKHSISSDQRIILGFSRSFDIKNKVLANKGFWWVEQPIFIFFMVGFLLNYFALIAISFIHFSYEPFSIKTIYLIIFWVIYTIATSILSCMMKAHLWDSHQLLKKIKYIQYY